MRWHGCREFDADSLAGGQASRSCGRTSSPAMRATPTVWLATQLRQMAGTVPRARCISVVAGTGAVTVPGRARATNPLGEGASMERKVFLLLQRDRETQQAENALAARLHGLERDISQQLREVRTELRDHFAHTLTETLNRCRSLRILGPFSAPSESLARFSRVSPRSRGQGRSGADRRERR